MTDKKKKTMLDGEQTITNKTLLYFFGGLLTILFGFYELVFVARLDQNEKHYTDKIETLKELMAKDHQILDQNIKTAIDLGKANSQRFNDLNQLSIQANGGGTTN
jgi:hypothetical protein